MLTTATTYESFESDPPPGVRRWLISCDESGLNGQRFYAFGSLWMAWQRRGNFQGWMREVRAEHPEHLSTEFKWQHVNRHTLSTYKDLVTLFFERAPLSFHCLLIEKAVIDKALHGGDYDLARRKFFTQLLTCKIAKALKARPHQDQTFRVWVDPIASRYPKADEVVRIVANHMIRSAVPDARQSPVVDAVIEHDSQDTLSIQLCDVLLGAVAATWQRESAKGAKRELQEFIAWHLGWDDLRSDTHARERKFNIWMFEPAPWARRVRTRDVVLRYALPPSPSPPTRRRAA